MKTQKAKVTNQPKKASDSGEADKSKKAAIGKYQPKEEEIREKAKEIYLERIARGEHGTSLDDWTKAERLLKESKK